MARLLVALALLPAAASGLSDRSEFELFKAEHGKRERGVRGGGRSARARGGRAASRRGCGDDRE